MVSLPAWYARATTEQFLSYGYSKVEDDQIWYAKVREKELGQLSMATYVLKTSRSAGSTQWKIVGRHSKQSTTRSVPENCNSVKQFSKPASAPRPERFVGPRARIDGVRRVWGTMKSSTSSTVSTALNRLTTLGSKLLVKCK